MADAHTLYNAALALLQEIPHVTVYAGKVDDKPPADASGRVFPYIVLWTSGGRRPPESRSLEADSTDDLYWRANVTVAAGDSGWVLQAATAVRQALDGQVLVPFSSPLEEDVATFDVLEDRDVRPHRMFLPMSFVCTTG